MKLNIYQNVVNYNINLIFAIFVIHFALCITGAWLAHRRRSGSRIWLWSCVSHALRLDRPANYTYTTPLFDSRDGPDLEAKDRMESVMSDAGSETGKPMT